MRRIWWCAGVVAVFAAGAAWWSRTSHAAVGVVFKLAPSSGYVVLNDVIVGPGNRIVSKFDGKRCAACIKGTAEDDYCRQFLENGDEGVAYMDYADASHWRFFTNIAGTSTDLTGNVDPTGAFMMSGTHTLSGAHLFFVGKAKFKKGTVEPLSLAGTMFFTSSAIQEFGQVKFKSVGIRQ